MGLSHLRGLALVLPGLVACHRPALAAPAGGSVVAVALNPSGALPPACRQPYSDDGTPCADVATPVPLSPAQGERLAAILADPASWSGDEAKCTLPLHAFAWLDEAGHPVQQVSISFLCDKVEATPPLEAQPTAPARRGLSQAGSRALRALCTEVGLPHCDVVDPSQVWGR